MGPGRAAVVAEWGEDAVGGAGKHHVAGLWGDIVESRITVLAEEVITHRIEDAGIDIDLFASRRLITDEQAVGHRHLVTTAVQIEGAATGCRAVAGKGQIESVDDCPFISRYRTSAETGTRRSIIGKG
ncbi:MAG: hypothetical protein C1943_05270 [Halochromatium sp.]|nr:hypothetical protein [Halochromatium sp.]